MFEFVNKCKIIVHLFTGFSTLCVGGGSLFAIHDECECYNPRTNAWHPIAQMLYRRSRSGVTSLRKKLYVVGG